MNRLKILLFCAVSFALISCDRVTKELAKDHLKDKEVVSYLHDTFRLMYVENTGAALNLGENLSKPLSFWLLSILPLVFLLLLAAYTIKNSNKISTIKIFLFACLFAGGIGNIIDRLMFNRHVTDFMNLGVKNFRTGIFNVADVCVTLGAIGIVIFQRQKKNEKYNDPGIS